MALTTKKYAAGPGDEGYQVPMGWTSNSFRTPYGTFLPYRTGGGGYLTEDEWRAAGMPIQEYGIFDPRAANWYEHPAAAYSLSQNLVPSPFAPGTDLATMQSSGYYSVPSEFQSGWGTKPAEFANFWQSLPPETRDAMAATYRSDDQARQQTANTWNEAANWMTGQSDKYAADFDTNQQNAIAAIQQAAANLQRPTGVSVEQNPNLARWGSEAYQAVPDSYVALQKAAAARDINKAQADAIAAANELAQSRGLTQSGLIPQYTAAAGFHAAGERADIGATLAAEQLKTNIDFRKWANEQQQQLDIEQAELDQRYQDLLQQYGQTTSNLGIAQADITARTAERSPYDTTIAALMAGPEFVPRDYTQWPTATQLDAGTEEWLRGLDVTQTMGEEAQAEKERMVAAADAAQDAYTRGRWWNLILSIFSGGMSLAPLNG